MKAARVASNSEEKPEIHLQDVWDWAYCPMRVWWRKRAEKNLGDHPVPITGESLMRRSVRRALEVYYRARHADRGEHISPTQALAFVWRAWLDKWGLDDGVVQDLLEYQERRRVIFDEIQDVLDGGKERERRYINPLLNRHWRKRASASGLLEMRAHIKEQAKPIGIPRLHLPDHELDRGPMRFADAFATSVDIIGGLRDLHPPDVVLAAQKRVVIDLLSCRLICVADLVLDAGKSNARGRPRKRADGPRQRQNLTYELHIFDQDLPLPFSIEKDLRVMALSQALPEDMAFEADEVGVKGITIRHMLSGEYQTIEPGIADGSDVLESLVRSFSEGVRVGAYTARMACGWHACGDCEFRAVCFASPGVMIGVSPPAEVQIGADQEMYAQVRHLLGESRRSEGSVGVLRRYLSWMSEHPELDPKRALWIIETVTSREQ